MDAAPRPDVIVDAGPTRTVLLAGAVLGRAGYHLEGGIEVTLEPPQGAKGVVVLYGPEPLSAVGADPAWMAAFEAALERARTIYAECATLERKRKPKPLAAAKQRLRDVLIELRSIPFDPAASLVAADAYRDAVTRATDGMVASLPVDALAGKLSEIDVMVGYAELPCALAPRTVPADPEKQQLALFQQALVDADAAKAMNQLATDLVLERDRARCPQ